MARQTVRLRTEGTMKRRIAPLTFMLLVVLAGCSSTSSTATSAVTPTTTSADSSTTQTPSPSAADTLVPSETPTSSPVAGGTATDFCGAFQELQVVNDATSMDPATGGAQMQAAAADMRKYAPAEIEQAANTYADVMDNIGKAAAAGKFNEATLSKAVADGMAGKPKDIAAVAVWVAKNCDL